MPRLPDFEAWAMFAKVAETGSFSRAATELGVSKATVSKAVGRLEGRIGAALLSRTSRRLSLTQAGHAAVAGAGRLLAEGETVEAEALSQAAAPSGLVRLAAPMSFGIAHLAPTLPDLLASYPALSIDLHLADHLVDLVGGGFDLALRIAALADSSLRARHVCHVRRLLVASPSYFARCGRPSHPSQLHAHACLGYAYLPSPDRWRFFSTAGEAVDMAPVGPLRINNADALMPALRAGLGLAVQPEFLVWEDLAAGRLEVAMADWAMPAIPLNIVLPPGRHRPIRVAAVADFLANRFAAAPWAAPAEREMGMVVA